MKPKEWTPPKPHEERMLAIVRHIEALKDMIQAEKNRLHHLQEIGDSTLKVQKAIKKTIKDDKVSKKANRRTKRRTKEACQGSSRSSRRNKAFMLDPGCRKCNRIQAHCRNRRRKPLWQCKAARSACGAGAERAHFGNICSGQDDDQ
jgi:hypothetical protein